MGDWTKIAADCKSGDCPTVYATHRGTVVVQGNKVRDMVTPKGETAVEIPEELLREAVRALGG